MRRVTPGPTTPSSRSGSSIALHVARFLIVDDRTVADNRVYGIQAPVYPRGLTFLGDVDGDADEFLADVSTRASAGLRAIFACCEGFTAETDLLQWMRAHQVPAAAVYVNWRGRTVRQVREDAALRDAVERHVNRLTPEIERLTPRQIHERLRDLVKVDVRAGRLTLSADAPTPMGWRIANLLHLASLPAVILILLLTLLLVPRIALLAVIAVAVLAVVRLRSAGADGSGVVLATASRVRGGAGVTRGSRRDQPVQRDGHAEAGAAAPVDDEAGALGDRLGSAAHLHTRDDSRVYAAFISRAGCSSMAAGA